MAACTVLAWALCCLFLASFGGTHPNIHQSQNGTVVNDTHDVQIDISKTPITRHRRIFFVPFARPIQRHTGNGSSCPPASDDDEDFPHFLTDDQLLKGGIVLVIMIGIYGFSLLAVVCNDYFLPCVETICEKVNLTPDVAAATFMSIATSTPEFFTNVIGTFVTKSDLGIGTIVGSSLFNALGVPAIGGLASPYPLQLDWYPLTRDSLLYVISVTVLIVITWDGIIYWFETLIPLAVYISYFVIMFNNKRIHRLVKRLFKQEIAQEEAPKPPENIENKNIPKMSLKDDLPRSSLISAYGSYLEEAHKPSYEVEHSKVLEDILEEDKKEAMKSLFRRPEGSYFSQFLFYYTWPIKGMLRCTVINPKVYPNWYPATFMMCIVWIGINSYVVSWMISEIGSLTKLPDALLGMTMMAVGGCLPETVSMTIIARRGEGAFGVSNSLGANTMNVLYSLGLPWLLKNLINGQNNPVLIQSGSIEYTIMSLVVAVGTLYGILLFSKFRLSKISGSILGCTYLVLVLLAILSQTVFFKNNC